jgi:dihydrodipicolinate synthase/N-acetylneuraminate lyase
MRLPRPPDAFLLLPVVGGYNAEGVCRDLRRLCDDLGRSLGARFILYLRDPGLRDGYCRMVAECEAVIGVKIGTAVEDVEPACRAVAGAGTVVWGIGDLSTAAARRGARGHTSGAALLSVCASDRINNAHRRGDYAAAELIEQDLRELEEIRFMCNRAYNYSAVIEALKLAAFADVDPGDGGPFNAPPPPEIRNRLPGIVERLRPYHSMA